ncbi:hypothetical protein GGR51DRAFT_569214 [Nemania sp. FL0031]|nr:hypothetical protein GGR51DRAFT_569214 [Nemania sp. FL0031]
MTGPAVPTPEQVAYMQAHASDNLAPNIIACVSISATAATVFVALRLWSRRIQHGSMNLDASDYLVLAAWAVYIPYNILGGLSARYGGGRHIIFVTERRLLQIISIVVEVLYSIVLAFLKFSILSLYRKIFGIVAVWVVLVLICTNLQCIPISYTWDPTQKGTCINYGAEALVVFIVDIITDLTILSMPIPLVWKLHTSKANKRGLFAVFAAGGRYHNLACNLHLALLIHNYTTLIGFLATSIATYRPLIQFLFSKGRSPKATAYISSKKGTYSNKPGSNSCNGDSQHGIMVADEIELMEHHNSSQAEPFHFN